MQYGNSAPLPGDPSCAPYCHPWFDFFDDFAVDAEGRIVFVGEVYNDNYDDPDYFYGVFVLPPSSVQASGVRSDARTVVLSGDVAPGTGGQTFFEFYQVDLAARAVAFVGWDASQQLGLFLAQPTTPPLPALSAPGLAALAGALALAGLLSALRGGAGRRRRA